MDPEQGQPPVRYCPGCGAITTESLAPGQVCAACESARPWRPALGPDDPPPRISITRADIERAMARRRGEVWKRFTPNWILRYALAVVAVACAAFASVRAVDLMLGVPFGDLESVLDTVRDLGHPAVWAGFAAVLLGVYGLISAARTRFHRARILALFLLLAVSGGGFGGLVSGMFWVGSLAFSFDHSRMPERLAPGSVDLFAEAVMAATVVIFAPDEDGNPLKSAIGTGTVVGRGQGKAVVLTCSHVAMPYASPAAWRDPTAAQPVWLTFSDGSGAWGQVVWTAPPPLDLVLVEAETAALPAPIEVSPDAGRMAEGDAVFFVPNPYRDGWLVHRGAVLSRREHETPAGRFSLLITDLPVEPGDSGSGLYDEQGRLVGVNTWRQRGMEGTRAISLPSDALRRVLDRMRDLNAPSGLQPQGGTS